MVEEKQELNRLKMSVERWRHRYYGNLYTLNLVLEKFKEADPVLFEEVMKDLKHVEEEVDLFQKQNA